MKKIFTTLIVVVVVLLASLSLVPEPVEWMSNSLTLKRSQGSTVGYWSLLLMMIASVVVVLVLPI